MLKRTTKWMCLTMLVVILLLAVAGCRDGAEPSNLGDNGSGASPPGQVQEPQTPSPEDEDGTPPPSDSTDSEGNLPENETDDAVAELLNSMTVKEKIGQLVLVGIEGTALDNTSRRLLEDYHVGGFIFFKDNIESAQQSVKLFNDLKEANAANPVPLWLSIDEEGGRVTRFPDEYVKLPSSGKVGSKGDLALTKRVGGLIAQKVAGLGLNMVFAPVLDINSNPNNPVIGDRSFGNTAETVSTQGIASMKGIQEHGVVPVVKHFPGHGDTSVDSHLGLPVVNHDLKRLHELELVPFQQAIDEGADVVMVAHLLMKSIDPDTPSSYSKPVINDLLREEMGFKGVVITDDMTMGAISGSTDVGEASVKSVVAGSNMILIGHEYALEEAVIQALTEAVESGVIPEETLNDRVRATLELKHKYQLSDEPVKAPDVKPLNQNTKAVLDQLK
ncbi:beta-N-acetylhexosaminidase [Virgibacillus sp. LDC1]|uniref:beta-N-acetylhexosaminidase n=1 Tax=Paenibacillus sp. GM2FR TaxID=2059268 RepID=UPI000C27AA52|nr:beta-N-acetylhexosaminidase [Paenibacillus sp. GM2FR]MCV4231949.1 beta-N-acetylhexosaminidase [Virgibacillus sp. LDC1]PJN55859.1 putative lipoprotein YbbD precursor [Paenibacillus sp. GM2FR]